MGEHDAGTETQLRDGIADGSTWGWSGDDPDDAADDDDDNHDDDLGDHLLRNVWKLWTFSVQYN